MQVRSLPSTPVPSLTPSPSVPSASPAGIGDRLTFSGEAKNAIRQALAASKLQKQKKAMMPKLMERKAEIAALLNETVFADINGLTLLKALEEDISEHKDSDGDVVISSFLQRLGVAGERAISTAVQAFLTKAAHYELTHGQPDHSSYIRMTPLGYLVSQDPEAQALLMKKTLL